MGVQGRRMACAGQLLALLLLVQQLCMITVSLEAEHGQELWHRDAGSKKEPGTRCPWGTCLPSCQLKLHPHCREHELVGGTQGCFLIAHAPL